MNQINLDIGAAGGANHSPLGPLADLGIPKMVTANKMKRWIKDSGLDPYVKEELIKKVDSYPAQTMKHFYKNIREHIKRIQEEKRKKR